MQSVCFHYYILITYYNIMITKEIIISSRLSASGLDYYLENWL